MCASENANHHPQIYKQMSFIRTHAPTVRGVISARLADKEHIRNTKIFKKGSNIASHAWLNDHSIDLDSARVIDKGSFRVRKTLESWHTAITNHADNNAKQLARQYSIHISIFTRTQAFPLFLL